MGVGIPFRQHYHLPGLCISYVTVMGTVLVQIEICLKADPDGGDTVCGVC
ncbi:hypothetical protein J2T58_001709 [Methanocalculus alkaliphilus]|nr:hypothetical protein [Methanocalculus alkaliphilus]